MTNNDKNELPDLPSDLIDLALVDVAKCKLDPRYELDMDCFHEPSVDPDICLVCVAGSVMANTLGAAPDESVSIEVYCNGIPEKLFAIDCFREGEISGALHTLKIPMPDGFVKPHFRRTKQGYSPAYLRNVSAELRRHGL